MTCFMLQPACTPCTPVYCVHVKYQSSSSPMRTEQLHAATPSTVVNVDTPDISSILLQLPACCNPPFTSTTFMQNLSSYSVLPVISLSMCAVQAVPLLQTVFRVEADSLHLTLVGRFLYDVMHFVTEVKDIAAALATPASKAAKEAKLLQCDRTYRPITEVSGFCATSCITAIKPYATCPHICNSFF